MRGPNGKPDWHVYHDMFPITLKAGATKENCSFGCPIYAARGGHVEYKKGDCPVADDLFDRFISVPLNQWWTARDCRNVAKAINKVLAAYCTEGPAVRPWR